MEELAVEIINDYPDDVVELMVELYFMLDIGQRIELKKQIR